MFFLADSDLKTFFLPNIQNLLLTCSTQGMAAIATQDPTGSIASVLHGPLHAQAPQRPGPLPSRILHPDEQLQRNQPFYVPTVQPLFPYQWSMSTPYVPYSGFHGLGILFFCHFTKYY